MLLILKPARCYGTALHLDRWAFDEALALAAVQHSQVSNRARFAAQAAGR